MKNNEVRVPASKASGKTRLGRVALGICLVFAVNAVTVPQTFAQGPDSAKLVLLQTALDPRASDPAKAPPVDIKTAIYDSTDWSGAVHEVTAQAATKPNSEIVILAKTPEEVLEVASEVIKVPGAPPPVLLVTQEGNTIENQTETLADRVVDQLPAAEADLKEFSPEAKKQIENVENELKLPLHKYVKDLLARNKQKPKERAKAMRIVVATFTTANTVRYWIYNTSVTGIARDLTIGYSIFTNFLFAFNQTLYTEMVNKVHDGTLARTVFPSIYGKVPLMKDVFPIEGQGKREFWLKYLSLFGSNWAFNVVMNNLVAGLANWGDFSKLFDPYFAAQVAIISAVSAFNGMAWGQSLLKLTTDKTVSREFFRSYFVLNYARSVTVGALATTPALLKFDPVAVGTIVASGVVGTLAFKNYEQFKTVITDWAPRLLAASVNSLAASFGTPTFLNARQADPGNLWGKGETKIFRLIAWAKKKLFGPPKGKDKGDKNGPGLNPGEKATITGSGTSARPGGDRHSICSSIFFLGGI